MATWLVLSGPGVTTLGRALGSPYLNRDNTSGCPPHRLTLGATPGRARRAAGPQPGPVPERRGDLTVAVYVAVVAAKVRTL